MTIQEKVRNYVEMESKKPDSHYGYEPFEFHFKPVVDYALRLSDQLGGDKEVLEIAAWMHDIGAIKFGRKNHEVTGEKIAREKLTEFGYSAEKTDLVCKCILNHRGSVDNHRESIEEKIIAEADALSNFDNVPGIFKAAFVYEGLSQGEAKLSAMNKLTRKYNKLHFEESRKLIKPKYEAAKLLLG